MVAHYSVVRYPVSRWLSFRNEMLCSRASPQLSCLSHSGVQIQTFLQLSQVVPRHVPFFVFSCLFFKEPQGTLFWWIFGISCSIRGSFVSGACFRSNRTPLAVFFFPGFFFDVCLLTILLFFLCSILGCTASTVFVLFVVMSLICRVACSYLPCKDKLPF